MKLTTRAFAILLAGSLLVSVSACAKQEKDDSPETTLPAPEVSTYVWESVERDPVTEVDETFSLDYTVLYANLDSVCTAADRAAYRTLIGAVLDRRETVSLDMTEYDRVAPFVALSPLYGLLSEMRYDTERMSASFVYATEETEQAQLLESLRTLCAKCSAELQGSKTERAVRLYRAVALLPFSYDAELPLIQSAAQNKFTAGNMAELLAFLFMQEGIPAVVERQIQSGLRWTAACPDGNWYHFIPSYESMDNSGTYLWYFGMTDSDVETAVGAVFSPVVPEFWAVDLPAEPDADEDGDADGSEERGEITDPAQQDRVSVLEIRCDSTRFAELRACGAYAIEDGVLVFVLLTDGTTVRIPLTDESDHI